MAELPAETWGLNAWFDDNKPGHIVHLRDTLRKKVDATEGGGKKGKGDAEHVEAQIFWKDKALKAAKNSGFSLEDAGVYTDFFSEPQRRRGNKEWDKKKSKWNDLDKKIETIHKREVSGCIDSYNKATKFILQAEKKELEKQKGSKKVKVKDMKWATDMIDMCDKMIALMKTADPSFQTGKLRNR